MKTTTEGRLTLAPRRRDFLAYGASLALLPQISWATGDRGANRLAIGYCSGALDITTAVAADRLPAGEASLTGAVRVTVNGLVGNAANLAHMGIRSAELRVGFQIQGANPGEVEFIAWSHQLLPVENTSAGNAFTVPVENSLALALDVETLGRSRYETVLSLGCEPGQPKLRAGNYLIGLAASNVLPQRLGSSRSDPLLSMSVEPLARS